MFSGAVGGGDKKEDEEKKETTEDGEDLEVAEARREEEEKRREKHRKMEEEREDMRAQIRKKVSNGIPQSEHENIVLQVHCHNLLPYLAWRVNHYERKQIGFTR